MTDFIIRPRAQGKTVEAVLILSTNPNAILVSANQNMSKAAFQTSERLFLELARDRFVTVDEARRLYGEGSGVPPENLPDLIIDNVEHVLRRLLRGHISVVTGTQEI